VSEESQELKGRLKHSTTQYRVAVRWLRDAKIYKQNFAQHMTSDGKTWKDGPESELAQDAHKAFIEAVNGVLYWRRQIDECNEKLIDMVGGKTNGPKSKRKKAKKS
jgi:hypothetical protein